MPVAELGGDGEAGWDGQAEAAHLREVGALASQHVPIAGMAFGLPVAKGVDPLRHACSSCRRVRSTTTLRSGRIRNRDTMAAPPSANVLCESDRMLHCEK